MDLEQELRAALVPCRPGPTLRAAVFARLSAGPQPQRPARRTAGRLILAGTVLVVAAAAYMLATQLAHTPEPASVVAGAPAPATVATPAEANVAAPPAPVVGDADAKSAPVKVESGPALPAVKPFTVSVVPPQNDSPEAPVREAVAAFHRTLLDGLRATPGVVLVTPESEEAAASTPSDYRLTMKGTGSTQANTFTIALKAMRVGRYVQPYQLVGNIAKGCSGTPDCGDAIGMANQQLNLLRESMFPESPARSQEMRTRLLDPTLGTRQRLDALLALESLRGDSVLPTTGRSAEGLGALRDPAVVHGAIALAAAASEDFVRAQVWKKMRGVGSADLIQPLIAAARGDSSGNVRAEAVMTLSADFAGDPRVRAALETITQQDSRPVVRVLAQSGLVGKEAWPRHVVASLNDTNLSDFERIEAIYYAMNQSQTRPGLADVLTDDESIRTFAQLLPRAVRTADAQNQAAAGELAMVLVTRLGSIDHPAVTDMLLDAWEHPWLPDTFHVLNQLARRAADPKVRVVLEKVSTGPSDSPLREIARNALDKLATSSGR